MAESGIWADYTLAADRTGNPATAATRSTGGDMDKNAFLQLLITQLKYQDPLSPMDNQQMAAQLAQFSALEQMQNLNKSFAQSQGYALVGRYVDGVSYMDQLGYYEDFDGRVASVRMKNGEVYLNLGDKEVKLSDVENVYEDYYSQNMLKSLSDNAYIDQSLALVGRTIQAITLNNDLQATGFVEGKVDYVKFSNGTPILVVGTKEIFPHEVVSVSDGNLVIGKFASADTVIDGETRRVSGPITGIVIIDGKACAQIAGYNIELAKIDRLIDALKFVGKTAGNVAVSGEVSGVVIKDGEPYLIIGDDEIPFSGIIK